MTSRNARTYSDSKFPKLSELFPETRIDNKTLGGIQAGDDLGNAKFNGCIIMHEGRELMCYRAYSKTLGGNSSIFIKDGEDNIELNLPAYGTMRQYEDARLFHWQGKLHVSYVVIDRRKKYVTAIHVAELDNQFSVTNHYVTQYAGNAIDEPQKNWIYWETNGRLFCIYDVGTSHIIELGPDFQPINVTIGKEVFPYCGQLRGGTAPVKHGDKWFAIAHGSMEHPVRKRRYFMVPYTFDLDPPFLIRELGTPIFGSLQNPIVDHLATWWCPIVLFPMGITDGGDHWRVSLGVNDLYTSIIQMPKNIAMESADKFYTQETRYYKFNKVRKHPGEYRVLKVGGGSGAIGVIKADNHKEIGLIENSDSKDIKQISKESYDELLSIYT